jgi:hypothetical protein
MKNILIILLLTSLNLFSQTKSGSNTLFQTTENKQVNGYASFDGSLANADGYIVGAAGVTLAATVNNSFSFGIVGSWIIDSRPPDGYTLPNPMPIGEENSKLKRYCGYGGVLLEPTLFPKFPLHLTLPCIVGIGSVKYALKDDNYWTSYDYILDKYLFYIFSVGARVELNVVDGLRVTCGPSYRYVPNTNDIDLKMNVLSLDFSIKIGKY